jgi:hypothetical protein
MWLAAVGVVVSFDVASKTYIVTPLDNFYDVSADRDDEDEKQNCFDNHSADLSTVKG